MKHFDLILVISLAAAPVFADGVVKPNRTLPQFTPPKTTLEFSANPTAEEISRARIFEEPLVPIGGEPSPRENAALAAAVLGYAHRNGPDDFASLTGFLESYPNSPWRRALLTGLGFEYYNTAHYSLALQAWSDALREPGKAESVEGMVVLARAAEELASLYARLGRMSELEALLKSVDGRGASEKIKQAREALWLMQNKPEVSFRCGPLALQSILKSDQKLPTFCGTNALTEIFNSASTQKGLSLTQVAQLSQKIGLNYQMAFRAKDGDFLVPSVVHWKVGHYAAMVRLEGDRYLLEDPTFGNTVWATRQVLEAETSGYFLVPRGRLAHGWRGVEAKEGATVWGKGVTTGNNGDIYARNDLQTGGSCRRPFTGMPMARIHLMTANLSVVDTPLAYTPPVGPSVRFTFRYNSRDLYAADRTFGGFYWNGLTDGTIYNSVTNYPDPDLFISSVTKITHDWISYLIDSPQSPLANVKYIVGGGGARTFKGFDTNSQSFAFEQMDQTLLKRTSPDSYEMTWPDGSKLTFGLSDGSVGSSRRVYLTQIADAVGNAVTFTYDQALRVVAVTDAIGQVTTVTYGNGTDVPTYLLTRVTDPFGRFATFDYDKRTNFILEGYLHVVSTNIVGGTNVVITETNQPHFVKNPYYVLTNITDMLGLASRFEGVDSDIGGDIASLVTPYGTNLFVLGNGGGNTRFAEIQYPDGSRERVEFNQSPSMGIPASDPPASVPAGMATFNSFLFARNTYYWSRTACASSYGDYTKAKIFHWLHDADTSTTSGILESTKDPLEGRIWYNYPGGFASQVGVTDRPSIIGRVLDDGQTQLQMQGYNGFGRVTNSVDPLGRTLSFSYAPNGIDLAEARQTRATNNDVLFRATYNAQHRPLTVVDAAGQTNTFTYNARGQVLTATNPRGETTSYTYDAEGKPFAVDGPLPGTNDTVTLNYDALGRVRAITDVSGYKITVEHDNLDRVTKITHPDSTFEQFVYDRLDLVAFRDRAARLTTFDYDSVRQMRKRTDPLGRETLFDWCRCGSLRTLTDPMGRTTTWLSDVQGRPTAKQYADGSQVSYFYEDASGRLRTIVDEKQQATQFAWNRDNTLRSVSFPNAIIRTPSVSFQYDPDYERVSAMTDGTGTTTYLYNPVTSTPTLGAGALASVDGPLPNDTITYSYDELGRTIHRAINGVDSAMTFDAAWRLVDLTNALGAFAYGYDGSSSRLLFKSFPNGLTTTRSYNNDIQDRTLQRITHTLGAMQISEFLYGNDVPKDRIGTWSQQVGTQPPDLFTFSYDSVNQLLSTVVTNSGVLINSFDYSYDLSGNRLIEKIGASNHTATYNGLNEIGTMSAADAARTNEWDALNRLIAVNVGNQRTEFAYDGLSRMTSIRKLVNGAEVSSRRFVWNGHMLCEERNGVGAVTKRFFPQGMKVEVGPNAGDYFYARDHLGSIRELIDNNGTIRARYSYDPYGRRTKISGDLNADFGFAGMFYSSEVDLSLTQFRAYDAELGRWLSRDPLRNAEKKQGPNLYAYVGNDPISRRDPLGLCFSTLCGCGQHPQVTAACLMVAGAAEQAAEHPEEVAAVGETAAMACAETLPAAVELAPTLEAAPIVDVELAPTLEAAGAQLAETGVSLLPSLSEAEMLEIEAAENLEWAGLWRDAMLNMRPDFLGDYAGPEGAARLEEMVQILDRFSEIRTILGLPANPF